MKFDNGLSISVLRGPGAIADKLRPYEAAMLDVDGSLVRGTERNYLTAEQVTEFMKEISSIDI